MFVHLFNQQSLSIIYKAITQLRVNFLFSANIQVEVQLLLHVREYPYTQLSMSPFTSCVVSNEHTGMARLVAYVMYTSTHKPLDH